MPNGGTSRVKAKARRRPLKIIGAIVAIIAGIVVAALIGFNIYIKAIYSDFYRIANAEFEEPGINSGFIPQDLDYLEDGRAWLFSGYMADGSPSPLYKRSSDGSSDKILVNSEDGSEYFGHGSAITSNERFAYLATEEGYMVLSKPDVENAGNGGTVTAVGKVRINVTPAFMNIEEGHLYAGNFYDGKSYTSPEEFHLRAPDGHERGALMFAYRESDSAQFGYDEIPEAAYSITDKVQGMCLTESGNIVLSTSWGFGASQLLEYDASRLGQPDGTYMYGSAEIPLYFLDSRTLVREIEGPPMFEGIEEVDGRVYIADESASDKYIFGKLYGAGVVFSIDM